MSSCPAGMRFDINSENSCIPCVEGTYNHGNMPHEATECYRILKDVEFVYLNATDVQCKQYWKGIPYYENGEYEGGCVDAGPPPTPSLSPQATSLSNFPTKYLSAFPTFFPTRKPSDYPTGFPSMFPSFFPTVFDSDYPTKLPTNMPTNFPSREPTTFPTNFPSREPTTFPTNFPSKESTTFPTSFPTFLCNIKPTDELPRVCMICIEDLYNRTIFPSASPTMIPSTLPEPLISEREIIKTETLPWFLFGGLLFLQLFSIFVIWGRNYCRRSRRPILQAQVREIAMVQRQSEEETARLPRNDSLSNVAIGVDE